MFSREVEKTSIDKLLAKNEVERVKELIKKNNLSREELLELLYMCSSTESKLLNLSKWDRYVMLKFFVWLREFIKVSEIYFDYESDLEKRKIKLSKRSRDLLENNKRYMEHNAKFLVDLYFIIARSTLSLGATGFMELLKNKFEMEYNQFSNLASSMEANQQKRWSLFGRKKQN